MSTRHPTRLSPPMRRLIERRGGDSWTMEFTGFGVNLASGNYEFAALIGIHDQQWWIEHRGDLQGN
jgi:hypothetical protein